MRKSLTIKSSTRLGAQAEEARNQGLNKVASHLDSILVNNDVRSADDLYSYSHDELQHDVEEHIWLAVARAMDFYDCNLDAGELADVVSKYASDIIQETRIAGRVRVDVGAFEPTVPGQVTEKILIELDDE